jgi:hypothetical protein
MTPRQEKLQRQLKNDIAKAESVREVSISNLVRAEIKLKDLRKSLARLERALAKAPPAATVTAAVKDVWHEVAEHCDPANVTDISWAEMTGTDVDDPIPSFLDRRKIGEQKDAEARARIEAENAERAKAKAKVRIEKLKISQEHKQAKLTGQTKKMPLSGRAALAHIMQG